MYWKVILKQVGEYVDFEFAFTNRADAFHFVEHSLLNSLKQTQATIEFVTEEPTTEQEEE